MPPVIELRGIKKRYGAVVALADASLSVAPGAVLGLVGDNGAGKSTLMKILAGALQPDGGQILVEGKATKFSNPKDARACGIEMVYQDLALCGALDVACNLYVGREPLRLGLVRTRHMHAQAARHLADIGVSIHSTRVPVRLLSGGQRQAIAIARSVSFSPRVLIMDEPTASLGVREVRAVLELIERVRADGVAVIFISHRLQDVAAVCDAVDVLYEGSNSAHLGGEDITVEQMVTHVVGGAERERSRGRTEAP
ncbi:MAG: ATP-binding cassette domain-containing protein [Solirubrobacterales bacterium]